MAIDPTSPKAEGSLEILPSPTERTKEELAEEVEALRRRVAELEIPAQRFQAIFASSLVAIQIFDPESRVRDVNTGFEQLWRLRKEDVTSYVALSDPQVEAAGNMPLVRAVFGGEPMLFPPIRYDPRKTEGIHAGRLRWVGYSMFPVKDGAGRVREVVALSLDIGDVKQGEEELRERERELEEAVARRTQELSESVRLLGEHRRAILELSTPVIRVWQGILVLPLVGVIDSERAAQITESLLQAIASQRAEHVILDITGVPRVDADVAAHLRRTAEATELLGARCTVVGVSPSVARSLVELGQGFGRAMTCATLQDGLKEALSRMGITSL